MNNKKTYFIIIILAIFIIIIYSYIFIKILKKSKNVISEDITYLNYEKYDKILEADDSRIYLVNNEEVTDTDIEVTKYLYQEDNDNEAKKIALENKVILQEVKKEQVELSEKDTNYIENLIQDLENDSDINNHYSENEKNDLIKKLSQNLYNNTLISQFKADFIMQLANETFSSDDEEILEKYNECLKIQEKWKNKQGVSYAELIEAREAVYNAYIQKLISQSKIE